MEWFVVKYWTKCTVLNHSDMETYVNKIVKEKYDDWYKIEFTNPKVDTLKFPENVVPLINTALYMCSFAFVHISLEKYPYSVSVIVYPILKKRLL